MIENMDGQGRNVDFLQILKGLYSDNEDGVIDHVNI